MSAFYSGSEKKTKRSNGKIEEDLPVIHQVCNLGSISVAAPSPPNWHLKSTKHGPDPGPYSTTQRHVIDGYVHAEWDQGHGGFHDMEVEVREEAFAGRASFRYPPTPLGNNTPGYPVQDAQVVVVRIEEVLLVALVLVIWVAAIALFFNRWGKIRMLEPYQPKFCQQPHRPSCPLAPLSPPGVPAQVSAGAAAPGVVAAAPSSLRNQKSIVRGVVLAQEMF